MTKYESNFLELGFYVDDTFRKFSNGVYLTDDKAEIAVLDETPYVVKVESETEEAKPAAKPRGASKK